MATTLVYGATTITLSDNLGWPDEYEWNSIEQKKTYSLTGALLVEAALKIAGRKITLASSETSGWIARSVVDALLTARNLAGQQFTLTVRGTAHTVIFDHEAGAMDARPVFDVSDPEATDFYVVTLRFLKV